MNQAHLKRAIDSLRLIDVVLHGAGFEQPAPVPDSDDVNILAQHKRIVSYATGEVGEVRVFQAHVALGVRLVPENDPDQPFVQIEADFRVVYQLLDNLGEQELEPFANHNCVHNVWPFWRQHVFDIVSRARLPAIEIPLYSGAPPAETAADRLVKTSRKKRRSK